ncbi:MAG TPA: DUF2867 domain-containing protein [Flavisolibacter sp.]|jgi:hypothetical protein|nr:DUF2867 domain-containing protein [Flavisolibacter sp.]
MTTLSFALPDQSFLFHTLQRCHYIDRCQKMFADVQDDIQLTDAVQAFFSTEPYWVKVLLAFRNKVGSFLGLKPFLSGFTEERNWWYDTKSEGLISFPLQLFSHSENEIVLGADDRHLNFRISFFLENGHLPGTKRLTVTTMVQFNNSWGRVYFLPVQPMHRLVMPSLLRNAVRTLEKKRSRWL